MALRRGALRRGALKRMQTLGKNSGTHIIEIERTPRPAAQATGAVIRAIMMWFRLIIII
jgi:hypothetical protein